MQFASRLSQEDTVPMAAGVFVCASLYPRPTKLEGGYTGFTLSVRLSVCPSVRLSVDDMVSGA